MFNHDLRRKIILITKSNIPRISSTYSTSVYTLGQRDLKRYYSTKPRQVSRSQKQNGINRLFRRVSSSHQSENVHLSKSQIEHVGLLHKLSRTLQKGMVDVPVAQAQPDGVGLEELIQAVQHTDPLSENTEITRVFAEVYAGKPYEEVKNELDSITAFRHNSMSVVKDPAVQKIMEKLKIIETGTRELETDTDNENNHAGDLLTSSTYEGQIKSGIDSPDTSSENIISRMAPQEIGKYERRRGLASNSVVKDTVDMLSTGEQGSRRSKASEMKSFRTVEGRILSFRPVDIVDSGIVPTLSYDLSRVLFNPGVYQLQDPRSRVYNFDPYLENIMPIEHFNFDALNKYIESSEDNFMRTLAKKQNKRYIGSTSSMSGVLSQFHFLLSNWRPLGTQNLSQGFEESSDNFTQITRAPNSVFLRWRDGVYAVDADKEHDSGNVLMILGRAMEKLLTLDKSEYERYRKSDTVCEDELFTPHPETYHYSTMGNFLMRAQLDAYDPRLPGSGMFDLKTRAVAGIRMNLREHEVGKGYQIKDRFGTWESYEREYFDMIRAAFLKYSLQVRMGRMDGIFVAYHNIERIFGFQYIPISELDVALHGQSERCLGDQEFRSSVHLMNEVFDQVTKEHPRQSIRFHFETREPSKTEPHAFMNIFAEPMSEEDITSMQQRSKDKLIQYEKRLLQPEVSSESGATIDNTDSETASKSDADAMSSTADTAFLDEITSEEFQSRAEKALQRGPLVGFRLNIRNVVNGEVVTRPEDLDVEDSWKIRYDLVRHTDEIAWREYTRCKNRRTAAFKEPETRSSTDYFLNRIRTLSNNGAAWRRQQDESDAQRERVVLYDTGTQS